MDWKAEYQKKLMTAKEAAKRIQDGDRIMGTVKGIPYVLIEAICDRYQELKNVKIFTNMLIKPLKCLAPEYVSHIDVVSYFKGPYERVAEKNGMKIDTMVYSFHRHAELIKNVIKPTVATIEVTPPDEEGYCYFGCGPVGGMTLLEEVRLVIVQVNPQMPKMYTEDIKVHVNQIDCIVGKEEPVTEMLTEKPSLLDEKVASFILEKVPNGATIQIGIGGIANAVGYALEHHKDLGVHTELYTESMMYLTKKGAINNSKKTLYPGVAVAGFALGSRELYGFLHENPTILAKNIEWVNDPVIVAKNDRFVSLNAMLGIDLLGQVSSESIGFQQFSGTGGQLDFVRGAQKSKGGMSFLAMHSVAHKKDGSVLSKICLSHEAGTAITVPRTDVQYVCTEYGIVNLQNQSIDYRARALISIAHPDFRDKLMYGAKKAGILI